MRDSGKTSRMHEPPGRFERQAGDDGAAGVDASRMPVLSDRLIADIVRRVSEAQAPTRPGRRDWAPSDTVIDALCDALISNDTDAAAEQIRRAEANGASADSLYLDYISAAARRMGERWLEDCASFLDVSVAGGRLATLVRELGVQFGGPEVEPLPGHSILITTVPGETHSLGATIAAEYFRRSRWDVTLLDAASMPDIDTALERVTPAVVGLSAGSRRMVPVLAETVRTVRATCPDAMIVVGGPVLALEPEIIRTVGADRTAEDPGVLSVMLRRHIAATTLWNEVVE